MNRIALGALALVALPVVAQSIPSETEFRVKLLAPLSTQNNKKGDKLSAQVTAPQEFAGGFLEGEVKEVKNGGKIKGKSVLNFTFNTFNKDGNSIPIDSQVKSVANSKGQQNVDEEGRIIEKKNNLGKAAAGTGIGALIGGIAGGAKGAAIGAGIGAAASLVLIETATQGPSITFAPGSEIVLSVKERRK
jgi:hypothetical protein